MTFGYSIDTPPYVDSILWAHLIGLKGKIDPLLSVA